MTMRGVKMKGTILMRMTQETMMKQAVDVLKLAGDLIQDAVDAGDDDILKDVIYVCEPIGEGEVRIAQRHVQRGGRWGRCQSSALPSRSQQARTKSRTDCGGVYRIDNGESHTSRSDHVGNGWPS